MKFVSWVYKAQAGLHDYEIDLICFVIILLHVLELQDVLGT